MHRKITLFIVCFIASHGVFSQAMNQLTKSGLRKGKWITYHNDSLKIKSFSGKFRRGKSVGKACYYTKEGVLEKKEINRWHTLKTTYYYPTGIVRLKGKARVENLPDRVHYYYYGKWKAYDSLGAYVKYYLYDYGNLKKTVYLDKHNLTNDSLIEALNQIDKEFTDHNVRLTDSINASSKQPVKSLSFKVELSRLDSLSFHSMEYIFEHYGYPSKSIVGESAAIPFFIISYAPWMIREKYVPLLTEAANRKDISWTSLAYYIDKLKIAKGEKQVYGTQSYKNKQGEYLDYPSIEPENLNKRRVGVGLEPIEPH